MSTPVTWRVTCRPDLEEAAALLEVLAHRRQQLDGAPRHLRRWDLVDEREAEALLQPRLLHEEDKSVQRWCTRSHEAH